MTATLKRNSPRLAKNALLLARLSVFWSLLIQEQTFRGSAPRLTVALPYCLTPICLRTNI
jgi:hypothetical protein